MYRGEGGVPDLAICNMLMTIGSMYHTHGNGAIDTLLGTLVVVVNLLICGIILGQRMIKLTPKIAHKKTKYDFMKSVRVACFELPRP